MHGLSPAVGLPRFHPPFWLEGKGLWEVLLVMEDRIDIHPDMRSAWYDVAVYQEWRVVRLELLSPWCTGRRWRHAQGFVDAGPKILAASQFGAVPDLATGIECRANLFR